MMRRMAALASGITFLCSASSALPAQEDPCTTRAVLVTVIDQRGDPVTGLTAANFRAKFRGKPIEILSVTPDNRPRRIVIVVDASGTMGALGPERQTITELPQHLFRRAPPYSAFALLVFSEGISDWVRFGEDAATLRKKLAGLGRDPGGSFVGKGGTPLYDALMDALNELSPTHLGDVIYVITDGQDNASKIEPSKLQDALIRSGTRLFAFIFLEPRPPPGAFQIRVKSKEGIGILQGLVEATGGNSHSYTISRPRVRQPRQSEERLRSAVGCLYEQMGEGHRLEIRLPVRVDTLSDWKLEVVDDCGKRNPKLRALYPRMLAPCSDVQEKR